jgi:hypothetical protein
MAPREGNRLLLAQLLSLGLTGAIVWFASIAPRLSRQPVGSIVAEALEYALLAWAWGAAIAFVLYLTMPRRPAGEAIGAALRTSTTAVWFAPATILLSSFSPGALIAALVLVVSATRLLYAQWRQIHGEIEWGGGRSEMARLAPSFAISCSIQCAMLAVLWDYPLTGAALFALSAAVLTLFSIVRGAWEPRQNANLPRSALGAALTVLLAAGLTVGGLSGVGGSAPDWNVQQRPGIWAALRELLRQTFYDEGAAAPDPLTALYRPGGDAVEVDDNSFPGVILWPEVKPQTTLVDPLPALVRGTGPIAPIHPLSIPFAGEYWMFKPPHVRPPVHSLVRRGDPVDLSFKTTDLRPMHMLARHRLERALDGSCCAGIHVEIRNADLHPWTVSLELLLLNSQSPGVPALSLGRARVQSSSAQGAPASEVLTFVFPDQPFVQFDEICVIFHRERLRNYRSAKISLVRFVLTPRERL